MWPFRGWGRAEEILRIGHDTVERWRLQDGRLALAGAQPLAAGSVANPFEQLGHAIRTTYAGVPDAALGSAVTAPVTAVIESAWLPVMLIDTGDAWLRRVQLEALVRHRFGLLYGDAADPVASWELRIEQRPGERLALAYAMPPRLKQTVLESGAAAGLRWAAFSPAWAWGMERLRAARRWPARTGWIVWPEQDRTLIAHVRAGRVVGLNAGAAPLAALHDPLRWIDAEAMRLGIEIAPDPVTVATWPGTPGAGRTSPDGRVMWCDICAPHGAARVLDRPRSEAVA